jgi:hypothetical protein
MSVIQSDKFVHFQNCALSEMQRQVAVSAASTQSAVRSAEILHNRTCLASAKANGCGLDPFLTALRELGVGQ